MDSSCSVPKALLLLDVSPARKGSRGSPSAALPCMVCFGQEELPAEDECFLLGRCWFSWADFQVDGWGLEASPAAKDGQKRAGF